jgi:hypothetical protein
LNDEKSVSNVALLEHPLLALVFYRRRPALTGPSMNIGAARSSPLSA